MKSKDVAAKAQKLIQENYTDSNFNVGALARMMGFHEVYIRKVFREHVGTSPCKVINACRMEKARELIREGRLPVAAVGKAAGIPDASYFCKTYKAYYGITPKKDQKSE